jgi:hypothetical protein
MLTALAIPDWLPFVGIGIVVLVAVLAISVYFSRKRTQAMSSAAMAMGFNFEGNDASKVPHPTTTLFTKGSGKAFRNIMTGRASGMAITLFDYSYVVSDGRNAKTHAQTVGGFSRNGVLMPEFAMNPKGIMGKITDVLSHKSINFESNPEFSRRYQVRGPEQERTREVFTPALLTFLESLDPKKNWSVEGAGDTIMAFRANKRVQPEELRTFFEESSSVASSFFSLSGVTAQAS